MSSMRVPAAPATHSTHISDLLAVRVPAIWFLFGDPGELGTGLGEQLQWQYLMQTEHNYLNNNNEQREQASKWVEEGLAKPQQEKRRAAIE
jgi:hypothetical protein